MSVQVQGDDSVRAPLSLRSQSLRFRGLKARDKKLTEEPVLTHREKVIRGLLIAALDDCVKELEILESVYKQYSLPRKKVVYLSPDERFGSEENDERKRLEFRIDDLYTNKHKLQNDLSLIISVLVNVAREVKKTGACSDMVIAVKALLSMKADDDNLISTESERRKYLRDLKNQMLKLKTDYKALREETNAKVEAAASEYEDFVEYSKAKRKFVDKWEKSRTEQLFQKLHNQEGDYIKVSKAMEMNMFYEKRVHTELQHFLEMNMVDLREQIEQWMVKYEHDIEYLDEAILKMRIDYNNIVEDHKKLVEEYAERVQRMIDWLEYKRLKRIQQIQYQAMIKAVVKIQFWWRKVMEIRRLGPFRKKKKGDKGKGKKKNEPKE